MEKLLIINGCSHSVGSEIPGPDIWDGPECRDKSFGSKLAQKLGRKPIHLAMPGGSNDWILRTSMAWLGDNLKRIQNKNISVIFLVHWTGAERTEFRFPENPLETPFVAYDHDNSYRNFGVGSMLSFKKQNTHMYEAYREMFAYGTDYWYDIKIRNIVTLQNTLKLYNIPYWFNNAYATFNKTKTFYSLLKLIDKTYYPYLEQEDKTFYTLCKGLGFQNKQGWHLREDAHEYYSGFLKKEFEKVGLG